MAFFTIHLVNAETVRPVAPMTRTITRALAPLCLSAGKQLNLFRSRAGFEGRDADLTLTFVSRGTSRALVARNSANLALPSVAYLRLGEHFVGENSPGRIGLILGDEGTGSVYVGAILAMRAGGGPQRTGLGRLGISYAAQTEPVFRNGQLDFALAVGNVAVHEIGHMIAVLPHTSDTSNFMSTGLSLRISRGGGSHNAARRRWYWAARKSFTDSQARALVEAIRSGNLAGGMRVE